MSTTAPIISEPKRSPEPTRPSTFCKAIFFYYACGCRTPEPLFCCRPDISSAAVHASNPCRHETPSVVIAKLPHSCKSGKTEACDAINPALLEFVREVDTAEQLDLIVLRGIPLDEVDTALPEKVDGDFAVGEVALRCLDTPRNPPALSSDTMSFVPRPYTAASISTDLSDDMRNILVDSSEENIDIVKRDEECERNEESENSQINRVGSNSDGPEEFFDIDLLAPRQITVGESSISRSKETPELEEPEADTSAINIPAYDDMMMFWALEETERHIEQASCWSILSLLGRFTNRRF